MVFTFIQLRYSFFYFINDFYQLYQFILSSSGYSYENIHKFVKYTQDGTGTAGFLGVSLSGIRFYRVIVLPSATASSSPQQAKKVVQRLVPILCLGWDQLTNMFFRDRKFVIESHDQSRYCFLLGLCLLHFVLRFR